jgi:hypothetical protein
LDQGIFCFDFPISVVLESDLKEELGRVSHLGVEAAIRWTDQRTPGCFGLSDVLSLGEHDEIDTTRLRLVANYN